MNAEPIDEYQLNLLMSSYETRRQDLENKRAEQRASMTAGE